MATTDYMTPQGLVTGFYNSFAEESTETGTEETLQWARAIVEAGDKMWNHPMTVEDAERYIANNA